MKRLILVLFVLCILVFFSGAYTPPSYDDVNLTLGKTIYTPPSRNDVNLTLGSEAPPVDTCTYVSGNWNVDCADNCSITSNTDVSGDIIIYGTGHFEILADITANSIAIRKGCEVWNVPNDGNELAILG